MNYLSVTNFFRGLFENEGIESKIANESLTKLKDVDVDVAGRMIVRTGYEKWADDNDSFKATLNGDYRIQNIYEFIDVGNKKYIVIIANGFIYFEDSDNPYNWYCINVSQQLEERNTAVGIAYYLDILFFNDPTRNIYIFNSNYSDSAILSRTREIDRQIWFNGNKIYLRNPNDQAAITTIPYPTEIITIDSGQPDGGNEIYNSLAPYPHRTSLSLGYSMLIDDFYYVLDNGMNDSGANTCSIIKFDKALLYVDHVLLSFGTKDRVLNFDRYLGQIVIKVKDEEINYISLTTPMVVTNINGDGDLDDLTTPVCTDGNKYHTVAVNGGDLYMYTSTLPDRGDWFQPAIIDRIGRTDGVIIKNEDVIRMVGKNSSDTWTNNGKNWFIRIPILAKNRAYNTIKIGKSMFNNKNELTFWWALLRAAYPISQYGLYFTSEIKEMTGYRKNYIDPFILKETILVGATALREQLPSYRLFPNERVHWNWDDLAHPTHSPKFPGETPAKSNGVIPDYANYLFNYHPDFHYNADNEMDLSGHQIYIPDYSAKDSEKFDRNTDKCFYIIDNGSTFNSDIFTDKNTSKYTLLVSIDLENGYRLSETNINEIAVDNGDKVNRIYRFIVPLGLITALKRPVPIVSFNDKLFFGTKQTTDFYKTFQYNINTRKFSVYNEIYNGGISNPIYLSKDSDNIFSVTANNMLLAVKKRSDLYDLIDGGRGHIETAFKDNNSNLLTWTQIKINSATPLPVVNDLRIMGTPKIPGIEIRPDGPVNFTDGQRFIYYVAYQFYSGSVTNLSNPSYTVQIDASIEDHTAKIVITGLNELNALGGTLYPIEDIEYINIYRQEVTPSHNDNGIYLIGQLQYDDTTPPFGWKTSSFTNEEFEDTLGTLSGSEQPYGTNKILKYHYNDIFVHMNRVIGVNNLDEENQNVCGYSETDMGESFPPSNIRSIQPGDGDYLVTGRSAGDYAYFFKRRKIYAILGDIFDGQLINIESKNGCQYKRLIVVFENIIYFLNDFGIFKIQNNRVIDINNQRIKNYFNKERNDSLNFDEIINHGYAEVDIENREILFFVPKKAIRNNNEPKNNLVIVYNIDYNYFKTRNYHDNISASKYLQGMDGKYVTLMGDYLGNIYVLSKSKNDNNRSINWVIRTKKFNMSTNSLDKIFKIIKISGRFLKSLRVTYWIDGEKFSGHLMRRPNKTGIGTVMTKLWNRGRAKTISIEISGSDPNSSPVEIDELLIGYDILKTIR